MSGALIGHSGFVGGNLALQRQFDACFNSQNIAHLADQSFDRIVCCGISATKWWANRNPGEDWAQIQSLLDVLARVQCREFVLISTIDVYADTTTGQNELADFTDSPKHAYGAHRLKVEHWICQRFKTCHIVRLPGLFGSGLKKNAIFDLQHNNQIDKIHPESSYQWYPLDCLGEDIDVAIEARLPVVNLFSKPVTMHELASECFPSRRLTASSASPVHYRLKSAYAERFGGRDGFRFSTTQILLALKCYLGCQEAALK